MEGGREGQLCPSTPWLGSSTYPPFTTKQKQEAGGDAKMSSTSTSSSSRIRAGPNGASAGLGGSGNGGPPGSNATTTTTTTTGGGPGGGEEQTISYSAERIIGHGSFGVVFQATELETREVVAIKKVSSQWFVFAGRMIEMLWYNKASVGA